MSKQTQVFVTGKTTASVLSIYYYLAFLVLPMFAVLFFYIDFKTLKIYLNDTSLDLKIPLFLFPSLGLLTVTWIGILMKKGVVKIILEESEVVIKNIGLFGRTYLKKIPYNELKVNYSQEYRQRRSDRQYFYVLKIEYMKEKFKPIRACFWNGAEWRKDDLDKLVTELAQRNVFITNIAQKK